MRDLLTTLCLVLIFCISAGAATITVTNETDSGAGSLRQAIADAAPGDLDLTFSGDGKLTDWSGRGNNVAIQSDGKIVVAGESNQSFAVARYNPDGSRDTTFGTDGKVIRQVEPIISYAKSVTIQSDGKIVAAGFSYGGQFMKFTVVRYNTNGSLDTTFDGDGIVQTSMGSDDYAEDVVIQTDGKIVVAGCTSSLYDFACDNWALARYNPDGSLDTTFDFDGRVITPFGFITDQAYLCSIAIQPDGKIVAAGNRWSNGSDPDFAIARYNPNGSLDTSFDGDGIVTTSIVSDDYAQDVAIQPDGKIVVGGCSSALYDFECHAFAFVRYNANGSIDTTFDSDGKVTTQIFGFGFTYLNSVAIRPDGKIVAAGYSDSGANNDFALALYNVDGSLDTTFGGGDGKTTADFDISNDKAHGMALDSQGRAVIVGSSDGAFAVARFLLGGTTPPPSECAYSFSADSASFSFKGGIGGFNLTTNAACSWTANSNVDWITVNSGVGTGNGSVTFTVLANGSKGGARSGTINVGSQIFTVNQDAPVSRKRGR